jgi:CO/xanthine dehydrogenase FAD-binding subunit
MKPAPFRYARPRTLDGVLALLADSGGGAKLLAGGQSLLPLLNLRLERPSVLIDLALVEELQVIARDGDELVIGSGVRQRTAETSSVVRTGCPLIGLALRYVGHVQTRSRGTIGGSLAHADPDAELPAVAVALDAVLVAAGPRGRRAIAARDFFRGAYATALADDEVLTELRLPVRPELRYAFVEVARPVAAVAAAVRLVDGAVAEARLAAIGAAAGPLRLTAAEDAARDGVDAAAAATEGGRVIAALVSRALKELAA